MTERLTPERLRALLLEHGWRIHPGHVPGGWRADSLIMEWRKPTPDYARDARWWDGETYTELRQVTWLEHDERLTLWTREAGAPWVRVTQARATQARVRAYIEEYGRAVVEAAVSAAEEENRAHTS